MDEVRVLETRDLCWSESQSSQKYRRGEGFNTGTRTSGRGIVLCQEDLREGSMKWRGRCHSVLLLTLMDTCPAPSADWSAGLAVQEEEPSKAPA